MSSSGFFALFVPFFVKLRSNSGKCFWVSCLSGDEMHLNLYAEPVVSQIFGDFFEIGVLKNLTAYIQKKASVWESLFNKVAGLQDTFKTRKRSFISAFSICMTVSLKIKFRSSHRRCFVKKGVIKNHAKFTGKHL